MVNKQIFLMSGFPRSGTTLLSTLLNQRPDMNSGPQSPLIHAMGEVYNLYSKLENLDVKSDADIFNMIDALPEAYYKDYTEPYIVNKHFRWVDPIPFMMLEKHWKTPIKIICPVRDILEILASFNKLANNDINNSRDIEVNRDFPGKAPLADKRASYWMESQYSDIRAVWQGLHRVLEPQYAPMFHIMEYDDLTNNPQETLDKISDFLEIERYEHDLSHIKNNHVYNDAFGLKNHHVVRSTIEKTSDDPLKVFSPEIIERYSNLEFWRNK
jgi:sulfotransferase